MGAADLPVLLAVFGEESGEKGLDVGGQIGRAHV
jgi:hypothetical protein